MASFLTKIFGSRNERLLSRYRKTVARINSLEKEYEQLTDADFPATTAAFRQRLAEGATLDSLLPEAFALVREASRRVMKMRHFDMQLIGAQALRQQRILADGRAHKVGLQAQLAAQPSAPR